MKRLRFFFLASAALMLGACSSDDNLNENDGTATLIPGEKGYISMAINLPSTTGTRAATYDDGTTDEYDVKNAKLLLFGGTSEADATCQGIYDLNVSAFLDDVSDQITSTAQIVQEVTKPTGDNLYALVVLNDNNVIGTVGATNSWNGKKFSDFYTTAQSTLTADGLHADGFFMTNAPLASVAGGINTPTGATVTTLSAIDASKIYRTETEALSNPATTVYVERAVGKVTVSGSTTLSEDANDNIASYTIEGWALDNTNKSTYVVRNVVSTPSWWAYQNGANGYRFIDGSPVKTGVSLYRTHFGIDPNYAVDYSAENFNSVGKIPASLTAADGKTPAYCLENTFNVAHMTEQNTTRVVVAAKLNVTGAEDDADFYLLNNNTSVIYKEEGVKAEVARLWMNYFESIKGDYIKNGSFDKSNVTVTLNNTTGGFIGVSSITMTEASDVTYEYQDNQSLATINAVASTYVTTINSMLKIAYYKGGVAYYPVLIEHFGDTETPWTAPTTGSDAYPGDDAENNWLGRYGVLRNTWYDISVTGLKNIGSPEVPSVTNTWDDPVSQYISVHINILAWAKRTQSVEL